VEVIGIQDINKAYDRLLKSDVKYRFSIDYGVPEGRRNPTDLQTTNANPRIAESLRGSCF